MNSRTSKLGNSSNGKPKLSSHFQSRSLDSTIAMMAAFRAVGKFGHASSNCASCCLLMSEICGSICGLGDVSC